MLYAYALVPASVSLPDGREGVRLKVESVGVGKAAKRSALLATDGRGSLRSSVTSVWGHKALEGVLDIDLELDVEIDSIMARREGVSGTQSIRVSGLISSAAWGQGRSSADRQFYYVNGRPCDLKQVGKAVNEIYKSFNTNQVPLAILDFKIPPGKSRVPSTLNKLMVESVDINVSPDKRTIFLHSEANLINALKTALGDFYAPSRSSFALSGASQTVKIVQGTQGIQSTLDTSVVRRGKAAEDVAAEHGAGDEEDEADNDADVEEQASGPSRCSSRRVSGRSQARSATLSTSQVRSTRRSPSQSMQVEDEAESSSSTRRSVSSRATRPASPPPRPENDAADGETVISRRASLVASTPQVDEAPNEELEFEGEVDILPSACDNPSPHPSPAAKSQCTVQKTLDTSTASWSPDRKKPPPSSSLAPSKKSGREARTDLRRKLAGFASQVSTLPVEEDVDEGETSNGGGEDQQEESDEVEEEEDAHEDEDEQEDEADETEVLTEDPGLMSDGAVAKNDQDVNMEDATRNIEADAESPSSSRNNGNPMTPASSSRTSRQRHQSSTVPSQSTPTRPSRPSNETRTSSGYRDEIITTAVQGEVCLRFDMARVRSRYSARNDINGRTKPRDAFRAVAQASITSDAGIANRDMARAEEALSRVISKDDFEQMEVLGQFNRGFIIARLSKSASDDLYIIDQHASDEKYNFETLQRTTVIKAQALIRPRALHLTAGDEIVAIENMDVLKANGFEVVIDEDKPPGRGERVFLGAMPVSKDTVFDFKGVL